VTVDQSGLAEEHVHTRLAVALDRIVVGDPRAHRAQPGEGLVEVRLLTAARATPLRHGQQRLGGDATGVQTVAAHGMALDQCDAGTESCRADGGDEPAGTCADHHQVVAVRRCGVAKIRGEDQLAPLRIGRRARIVRWVCAAR